MNRDVILVINKSLNSKIITELILSKIRIERIIVVKERNSDKIIDKIKRDLASTKSIERILLPINYIILIIFNFYTKGRLRKLSRQKNLQKSDKIMVEGFKFQNINSKDFIEFINKKDKALIFNFGTSIYTKETLLSIKHEILNIHTGILPAYRNVYSEFWALKNKDYSNVGTTIFKIDDKIDQGTIISKERLEELQVVGVPFYKVVYSNLDLASDMVCRIVNSITSISRKDSNEISGYYKTPGAADIIRLLIEKFTSNFIK
jgi:hypothetical protein